MDALKALFLGVIQGATEFLPVSSSGHLVIFEHFVNAKADLTFDAFVHLGTLLAVLLYFREDWKETLKGVFQPGQGRRLLVMLVVATIPGAVAGLLLEDIISEYFRTPQRVALTLALASIPLALGEVFGKREKGFKEFGLRAAILVGFAQVLALFPGTSRSGITISAAMLLGFSRAASAHFSFLLSAPIIAGAGLVAAVKALKAQTVPLSYLLVGAAAAFFSGWLAISFLLNFVKTKSFYPFVIYRLGLATLIYALA